MNQPVRWVFILAFFITSAAHAAVICIQAQTKVPHIVRYEISDRQYTALETDPVTNLKYLVDAKLDAKGTLTLDFDLKSDFGQHSEILRGKDEFKKILLHFGENVKRIRAQWYEEGDNYQIYQSLISRMSPTQAAANTWTGIQARAAGFTRIRKIYRSNHPDGLFFDFERP